MWLLRFGGVCGVVLGLSLGVPGVVEAFTGETAVTSFVVGLGAAFGPPALMAFYLRQREPAGPFGAFAFAANLIGLGLFAGVGFALNLVVFFLDVPSLPGPTRAAILCSAAVFVAGTVLFGISLVRSRVFPLAPSLGYTIALPLLALAAPLPDTVWTSALHVVGGASIVWLSWKCRTAPVVSLA